MAPQSNIYCSRVPAWYHGNAYDRFKCFTTHLFFLCCVCARVCVLFKHIKRSLCDMDWVNMQRSGLFISVTGDWMWCYLVGFLFFFSFFFYLSKCSKRITASAKSVANSWFCDRASVSSVTHPLAVHTNKLLRTKKKRSRQSSALDIYGHLDMHFRCHASRHSH